MVPTVGRSALLCALAAPAIGCVFDGALMGSSLFTLVGEDVKGEGMFGVFYRYFLAFFYGAAGPFGLLMGSVAGLISFLLVQAGLIRLGLARWLAVHGLVGVGLGALVPVPWIIKFDPPAGFVWRWTVVAVLTGGTYGALVGYLAWNPAFASIVDRLLLGLVS